MDNFLFLFSHYIFIYILYAYIIIKTLIQMLLFDSKIYYFFTVTNMKNEIKMILYEHGNSVLKKLKHCTLCT